jgi:hypothetical protein
MARKLTNYEMHLTMLGGILKQRTAFAAGRAQPALGSDAEMDVKEG